MVENLDPAGPAVTAFDEFLDRFLRGEEVDPDAFIDTHPGLSDEERHQIRTLATSGDDAPGGPAPREDVLPIERIATFRLIRRIGAGASGAVYLADDESLGRTVAVKVLGPDLLGKGERTERFDREARAVARLRHPNIVTIHAAGEEAGLRYIAMEYVPGSGLDDVLESAASEGSLPAAKDVIRWGIDLANALACAHGQGVVHRDVKPSNIRIAEDRRAVLLDFGIARADGAATLTQSGDFRGSPQYASPEQIGLAKVVVDDRTDVYSLGVTLYELLTGAAPFRAPTRDQLFHQILTREPVGLRRLEPSVPRDLETIVLAMLEKDPARRPRTAAIVAADLQAVLDGRPITTRPVSPLGRMSRWAKREPAKAVLAASLAIGIPLIAALGVYIVANRSKIEKATAAERAAELAAVLQDGFLEYGEGDPTLAVPIFERALRIDPGSAEAKAGYATSLTKSGNPKAAIAFLDGETPEGSVPAWVANLRWDAFSALSGTDPRHTASRSATRASSIDHFVSGLLALDRVHRGEHKAAEVAYDRMLSAVLEAPSKSALYYYELGHAAWHAHRHQEARAIAGAIAREWPTSPTSAFAIGRTLLLADPGAAHASLAEAAKAAPHSEVVSGFIVAHLGITSEYTNTALEFGRRALAVFPKSVSIRVGLSATHRFQGDFDAAITEARDAIRLRPDHWEGHRRLADACIRKGDYLAALEPARVALKKRPLDLPALNAVAIAEMHAGNLDEAVRCFEKGLELTPNDAHTLVNLGRALMARGDFPEALARLEAGHRIGSKYSKWTYSSGQWIDEARELIVLDARREEIRRGDETSPAELVAIARRVCRPKRLHAEAAQLFERAFEEDPALSSQRSPDYLREAIASAATAGLGKSVDSPSEAAARTTLLTFARSSIAQELGAEGAGLASQPGTSARRVTSWLRDPAIVATRTGEGMEPSEADAWRALWERLLPLMPSPSETQPAVSR